MRSLNNQGLRLVGSLGLASLLLAGCDNALELLSQLDHGSTKPSSDGGTGPAKDPGKDPAPAPECKTDKMGGDTSCKSIGVWKMYAGEACAAAGLQLREYSAFDDCGDGNTRFVKYTCCK